MSRRWPFNQIEGIEIDDLAPTKWRAEQLRNLKLLLINAAVIVAMIVAGILFRA